MGLSMSWKLLLVSLLLSLVHISFFSTSVSYPPLNPKLLAISPLKTCPPPTSTPGAPTQGRVAHRTVVDQGDLVAVLRDKGVVEANKSDLRILVNALKSFKEFKAGYQSRATCSQILAITKLLNEAVLAEASGDSSRPAMQRDINKAVDSINYQIHHDITARVSGHPAVSSTSVLCEILVLRSGTCLSQCQ